MLPFTICLDVTHTGSQNRTIKTAVRVFEIIELIRELDGATLTELSEHIDIADSTLYDYLTTLVQLGYLSKKERKYEITLRFFDHGVHARNRFPIISKSRSELKQLAVESSAAVWLIVEEGGKAVYLAQEFGKRAIETHERLGKHEYMHCLAAGKAMLAFSSEKHIQDIIDRHGLPQKTPMTITSTETLMAQLSNVREQGYATNEHETVEGVSAVAAPIVANERVYGAIVIAASTARMNNEEYRRKIIELVTTASNEIELKLTYK